MRLSKLCRATAALAVCICVATATSSAEEPVAAFTHIDTAEAELTPKQDAALQAIKKEVSATMVQLVKIGADSFSGDATILNVTPTVSYTLHRTEKKGLNATDFSWTGVTKDSADKIPGLSQFVFRDGKMYGQFQKGNVVFSVRPIGNGLHAVVKRELKKLPEDHPPAFKEIEGRKKAALPPETDSTRLDADAPTDTVVRVMIVYTDAVDQKHGDLLPTFLSAVVDITNQTYSRCRIPLRLDLANTSKVTYPESGSLQADLRALMTTNDNVIDHIHGLRDTNKADVVVLMVAEADYAGLAADILATPDTAFAVVDEEYADWYFTFAHEIGHLQGARHDPSSDPNGTYEHGFQNNVEQWRTIMAYQCPGSTCARIGYWSSPGITYNGVATGAANQNDNARKLRETAETISKFRD